MTSSDLVTRVVERSGDLDVAEWDSICGANPFARHAWLRLIEDVRRDHLPRYVEVREDGRLVAGAVCHFQARFRSTGGMPTAIGRRLVDRTAERWPPLVCSVAGMVETGLVLPDVDRAGEHLAQIVAAMRGPAAGWAPFVAFSDLPGELAAAVAMTGAGVVRDLAPEAVLALGWPSFDDYLTDQPRKTRAKLRNYRTRAHAAGVELAVDPLSTIAADPSAVSDVQRLIAALDTHHGNRHEYLPGFLVRAAAVDDRSRCITARIGGALVASGTVVVRGDRARLVWFGLDHDRAREAFAYHAVMTEAVAQAIGLGAAQLALGPTTYVLKRQLGARLEPRHVVVVGRGRLGGRAIRAAAAMSQWRSRGGSRAGAADTD